MAPPFDTLGMDTCPRCGSLLPGETRACPVCGEPSVSYREPGTSQSAAFSGGVATLTEPLTATTLLTEDQPGFQWSIEPTKKYSLAVAALALGILGIFIPFVVSIPAVIIGIVALNRIRGSGGDMSGEGHAAAAIALGAAGMLVWLTLVAVAR